jgi:hypothetical protein
MIGIRRSRYNLYVLLVITLLIAMQLSILETLPAAENLSYPSHQFRQSVIATDTLDFNLTYYTPSYPIEVTVLPNSTIAGDHVILRAKWNAALVTKSRLQVLAPAIPASLSIEQNTNILEMDTRNLGNNATCLINSTAWLTNGSIITRIFENVYIGNYFVPKVTVLAPNGGEEWTGVNTIQWLGSDVNSGETLHYDVLISSDSGLTFVTIASSLTQTSFDWNCSSYYKLDTYVVEIRVTDGIYFSSDRSNSPFTAGEIITSQTTTGNNTSPIDNRIAVFVVVLIVSSMVMALMVYYVARKWF